MGRRWLVIILGLEGCWFESSHSLFLRDRLSKPPFVVIDVPVTMSGLLQGEKENESARSLLTSFSPLMAGQLTLTQQI